MINYDNIAKSIEHFKMYKYKRIETPWTVTEAISNLTKPPEKENWKLENKKKVLVGSAEQGFLYLILKGFLPRGRYQSVSPCFRDEVFDLTHSKYFIKNELIITDVVDDIKLDVMINDALYFFGKMIGITNEEYNNGQILYRKQTGNFSYDIEYKGIELGSYGIRENELIKYIYGTACAEPRLSYCQKLYMGDDVYKSEMSDI